MSILKTIKITKGEDASFSVFFKDKETDSPTSMADFTSATLKLRRSDQTLLSISGSLESADLAKVTFEISDTNTALLMAGHGQDLQVELVRDTDKKIHVFEKILRVVEQLS